MSTRLQRSLNANAAAQQSNLIPASIINNTQPITQPIQSINVSQMVANLPSYSVDYINALSSIGTADYIKGLKNDLTTLQSFHTITNVSSNTRDPGITINGKITSNQSISSQVLTNEIGRLNGVDTPIQFRQNALMNTLFVSTINPESNGADVTIQSTIFDKSGIQVQNISHKGGVNINGVIHNDSEIVTRSIKNSSGVNINNAIFNDSSLSINVIRGLTSALTIGGAVFSESSMKMNDIQTNKISESIPNKGVTIEGVTIKDGTIGGLSFNAHGEMMIEKLHTSIIKGVNNKVRIEGDIELDNAQFHSGSDNGFRIDDVIFKNGNIYVNNILHTSEFQNDNIQAGISISGVSLYNREISTDNGVFVLSKAQEVQTRVINEIDSSDGVNVNGIQIKDNKIFFPSISGDDSTLALYNQSGQIKLEAPDGSVYVPPNVTNWMDWIIQNNDQFVSIQSNTTRFTLIDQSVWVNINIQVKVSDSIPDGYDKVWISLPNGYKSTHNNFQTFCTIENITSRNIEFGKVYINGVINNDIIYFEFNKDTIIASESYIVHANMVYEYEYTQLNNELTPWQSWQPRKKDIQLQSVAINNTRYYRIGSNVWLNIDIDITMSASVTGFKYNTYISLPPRVHAKNIYFTNPALIQSEDSDIIGSISTGISNQDTKLGTNILRITNPDGFEANLTYTIKGQIIFEEANASGLNFFFEHIEYDFGMLQNGNYGFMNQNEVAIEFIHNVDTTTISNMNWLAYFMKDSFNVHIANDDGYSLYSQMIIEPHRHISQIAAPWRVVKKNEEIYLQFTVDGKHYHNQFVVGFNDEDPY